MPARKEHQDMLTHTNKLSDTSMIPHSPSSSLKLLLAEVSLSMVRCVSTDEYSPEAWELVEHPRRYGLRGSVQTRAARDACSAASREVGTAMHCWSLTFACYAVFWTSSQPWQGRWLQDCTGKREHLRWQRQRESWL